MYVGRIVAVGRSRGGSLAAMYRVSSRSFPNRHAVTNDRGVAIVPKEGHETDVQRNPYIAYNCLRLVGDYAVATNGAQTDPVADKLATGMSPRDALALSLLTLDYEHDHLNTPRIAAIVKRGSETGCLGIVRHDGLMVREFPLEAGTAYYVCTYEKDVPSESYRDTGFDVKSADAACEYMLTGGVFAEFERPVTAVTALQAAEGGFETAAKDAG